jgi:hypothetical protein
MSAGLNSVKKDQIPEASGLLPITMRLASGFGIAYFANYLATKKVYYLTRYGDKINYKNNTFIKMKSTFGSNGLFKANTAVIANSAKINPGMGFIDSVVKMFATVQSYDDVFVVAGVICLIGIIPALMLKNKIHR